MPHRPPVAAGRRLPSRMALSLTEMEAAAFGALEKEAHLDEKLGAGVGAQKERAVIQAAVQAYEDALAANEAAALAREAAEAAEDAGEEDASPPERTLYHVATDHIAVFGGDPARRKDKVSMRMPPTLRLYSPYSGYTYCPGEQAHAAVRLARAVRHAAGRGRGRPEAPRLADPQRQARRRILLDPVRPTLTHTPHPHPHTPPSLPLRLTTDAEPDPDAGPEQVQQPRLPARHTPGVRGHAGGRVRRGGLPLGDEQLLVGRERGRGHGGRRRGMTRRNGKIVNELRTNGSQSVL